MNLYEFTIILAGVDVLTPKMGDSLELAGIDDATMGSSGGAVFLDFHREARSLGQAIDSAIADIRKAGYAVARVEVEAIPAA